MSNDLSLGAAQPGIPFGRYSIRRRLARGGMGEVFLADQLGPLGPVRPVALKRMLPKMARDPNAARMFLEEMATAAQLNHANIATTYDFGEVDGVYFLAMEYVEGLSLKQVAEALGPLPIGTTVAIAVSIADALAYAHGRKPEPVVHRDVSPHNVMISSSGVVKLLDFGIARAEAAALGGKWEGKLAYAAPEQLRGEPPDRRSDLWALGVVLYECLAGVRPFEETEAAAVLERAAHHGYVPISELRPEAAPLSPLIDRALRADPEARWQSAELLRRAFLDAGKQLQLRRSDAPAVVVERARSLLPASAEGPAGAGTQTASVQQPSPAPEPQPVAVAPKPRGKIFAWSTAAVLLALGVVALEPWRETEPVVPQVIDPGPVEVQASPPPPPIESPPPIETPPPIEAPPPVAGPEAPSPPAPVAEPRRRSAAKARRKPARAPVEAAPQGLGLLSVRAVPWAKISLDGKELGSSPLANLPVSAGTHRLTLAPGNGAHPPRSIEVQIRAGALTRVLLDFERGELRIEPSSSR